MGGVISTYSGAERGSAIGMSYGGAERGSSFGISVEKFGVTLVVGADAGTVAAASEHCYSLRS